MKPGSRWTSSKQRTEKGSYKHMSESRFRDTIQALEAEGMQVLASKYYQRVFGSWFIEVKGNPLVRVSWDGREGWVIIETAQGKATWVERWIGRTPEEQSVEVVVQKVRELVGTASPPPRWRSFLSRWWRCLSRW